MTDKGDIVADHVVSCTGNFARRTGAMVGLNVPVIPVEHQYIVTEPHPAIVARKKQGLPEMGVLRESDSSWYMREENGGLLLGPYEKGAPACYVDGPSDESEYELFQEDLERLMPHIEAAIVRVPAFGEVGIKKVYNGAIAYTPDGSPIVGPAPGLKNFWLNEGHSFGVTAAGGAGWQIAEWIVDGEPTIDMMGVDPRRFGPYATEGYLKEKNEEAYANVFTMHYPDEERAAARPLKTTPCYSRMKALGAVFGSVYGWERPNWFAPAGYAVPKEELGVGADVLDQRKPCAAAGGWPHRREVVVPPLQLFRRMSATRSATSPTMSGLQDMSAFAKAWVGGAGARGLAGVDPRQPHPQKGRAHRSLPPAHPAWRRQERVHRLPAARAASIWSPPAPTRRTTTTSCASSCRPTAASSFFPVTTQWGVLVLAGPNSRKVLGKLTRTPLDNASFPWLSGKQISVGTATAHALRVNFVGELGWELHHPIEQQAYHLRQADGGGSRVRHQAVRHPRHDGDGHREELPADPARAVDRIFGLGKRARPLRPSQQGRFHRPRRAGAGCARRARNGPS